MQPEDVRACWHGGSRVNRLHDQRWRALLAAGARVSLSRTSNSFWVGRARLRTQRRINFLAISKRSSWADHIQSDVRGSVRVALLCERGNVRSSWNHSDYDVPTHRYCILSRPRLVHVYFSISQKTRRHFR